MDFDEMVGQTVSGQTAVLFPPSGFVTAPSSLMTRGAYVGRLKVVNEKGKVLVEMAFKVTISK